MAGYRFLKDKMRLRRDRVDELNTTYQGNVDMKKERQRDLEELRVFEVNKLNDMEVEARNGEKEFLAELNNFKKVLED